MNREIKFRAWDNADISFYDNNENSRMSYFGPEYWINDEGYIRFESPHGKSPSGDHDQERFTLMQYTGLKDKNGKEIYEGDIIEFEYHNGGGFSRVKEPVTFYNGQFSVWQESINNYNENCEIIGNIFENPKILNENNLL